MLPKGGRAGNGTIGRRILGLTLIVLGIFAGGALPGAQFQMPDPKEMAGIPRPDGQMTAGAVSVRLIRGDLSNNIVGHPVELHIGDKVQILKTDDAGRVEFTGLPAGYAIKTMTRGTTDLMNTPLRVDATIAVEEVRISIELNRRDVTDGRNLIVNGTISGRLLNADGTPAPGTQIHAAAGLISPSLATAVTDSAGNFRLENLAPGFYNILIGPNPGMPTPSRIVTPRGAQIVASDPALQVSLGYGTNVALGNVIVGAVSNLGPRAYTLYKIQQTR